MLGHIVHQRIPRKGAHAFLGAQDGLCKWRIFIKQRAERFMRNILRRVLRHEDLFTHYTFFTLNIRLIKL